MNQTLLALIVGVLAGAAAGFLPQLMDDGTPATEGVTTEGAVDDGDIAARLEQIEATLARLADGQMKAAGLKGTRSADPMQIVLDDATIAKLKETTKASVKEGLTEAQAEAAESGTAIEIGNGRGGRRGRKNMKLADAAKEIGLSAAEEDQLRQIYSDTYEKTLKLLAGEDGDVEDVRRDLEMVRKDPSKGMTLIGKYMPRVMPKMGEFIGLRTGQQARVREALGDEKADKLRGYNIEEANPLPIGGRVQIDGRMGGSGIRGR